MANMKMRAKLSEYLRSKRIESGLTQAEVATRLGYTSPQFISNWERGLASPPAFIIKDLAKIYQISADDLFQRLLKEVEASLTMAYKKASKRL